MRILYLHGLESKLSLAKREILEGFGAVTAPDLNYKDNPNVFNLLLESSRDSIFDVVIGSSMGGFMGYYLANTIGCPALLFNPALVRRSVEQHYPEIVASEASSLLHFALGGKDDVVLANENLVWISQNRMPKTDIAISVHNHMQHQIPLNVFKIEINKFFDAIKFSKHM